MCVDILSRNAIWGRGGMWVWGEEWVWEGALRATITPTSWHAGGVVESRTAGCQWEWHLLLHPHLLIPTAVLCPLQSSCSFSLQAGRARNTGAAEGREAACRIGPDVATCEGRRRVWQDTNTNLHNYCNICRLLRCHWAACSDGSYKILCVSPLTWASCISFKNQRMWTSTGTPI